jgi:hypothetical protein
VPAPKSFAFQRPRGVWASLLEPVDIAWLAALRALLGLLLSVSMLRFLAYGWVDQFFVRPRFHFKYLGFAWVEPLPAAMMRGLFWALACLALMVAVGFVYRLSAPALAAGLTYFQLIDVTTYLNHYYLAALLAWLLALTPAHRAFSVDAWLARRLRPSRSSPVTIPRGVLYLFRFQVGAVYLCAGLAKMQPDWLLHAQPLRIWLGSSVELPLIGEVLRWSWIPLCMSWLGCVFDTTIVLWLSFGRTRPYAYAVLLVFHALTRVLFPIGMFPAIMSCAALVFFSPSWPRRLARLCARGRAARWLSVEATSVLASNAAVAASASPSGARPARVSTRAKWWTTLGVMHCLLQALLPLRCAAYGGNVLWHEQGMRLSWRVMLRAKGGDVTFRVRDPSGRTYHVSPRAYLNDLQESEMSSQPDLILQLAQHIARDFALRGHGRVAVYADARVALNGRRSRPMIDPNIDLTAVQDGLAPARWVLPAPDNSPPHTRAVP